MYISYIMNNIARTKHRACFASTHWFEFKFILALKISSTPASFGTKDFKSSITKYPFATLQPYDAQSCK